MKTARMTAFAIVVLMLLSITASLSSMIVDSENESTGLVKEVEEKYAPNSPGHTVFAQYITSDNCGFCYQYGSPGHHQAKSSLPDEYVYISYHSANYGNTADAESGNIAPIYGVQHLGETGGAPKTSFGDDTLNTGCGSNTCWDSFISSGGNMHSSASDYSVSVTQTDNGDGTVDISIGATYSGSGTAPSSVTMYAAVTEKVCNSHVYSDGSKGHNCWESWLLNGGAYTNNGGNVVGGGTGFETISLSSGQAVKSWTVPANLVSGGESNMNTVAALYSTWSTSSFHADVYAAGDSTMAPPIDVGISTFNLENANAPNGGYINGDIIDIEATIINNGADAYTDGGDVRFYYRDGNTKHYVGSTHTLANFASNGDTQPFSGQIDTTGLPAAAYQTSFGVELSNLVSDRAASNNDVFEIVPHDLVPVARKAEVIGSNNIERGNSFLVEAKAGINDGVDINLATMTFEIEVSPTGVNQWNGDIVSGGDEIFNEGTSNEHRQYLVQPTMSMGAGDYDLRSRAIDSRGQMSSWEITEDSFALLNALPIITAEPVPTVKVQTTTRVSIIANVADAETDLSDLVITSSSPNFIAWHASSEEVEVYFENIRYVGGEPVASGIEVSVDDGTDVAHGTLLFNVIENGQPRWAGVEKQYVDEASSDILDLIQYLSDTDSNGNVVTSQDLVLAIVDNTNPEILNVELSGSYLEYETTDDDVNGMTTVTVRASDGIQFSDQQITIQISPINDAPRLDLSEFEGLRLKAGTQQVIFVDGLLTDIDSDVNEAFVTVTNAVPGAARYNIMDNTITLQWDQAGMQTVTIQSADRYDSNIYTLVVDVYDSAPLLVGEGPDADVRVSVIDLYIDETPAATLFLNKDDVTITSLTSTWQLCNELTGVCTLQVVHEHDITAKSLGWTFDPFLGQVADGMRMKDQVKLTKIVALDNEGNKYEFKDAKYWTITEEAPGPETMDDETLAEYIVELEDAIDSKEDYLATLTEGTTEHTEAKEDLVELRTDLDEACEFGECTSDAPAANTGDPSSSIDLTVILIVVSVVVLGALAALLFMRGGRKTEANDFMVDWANQLPSNDAVANSMYGGAGEIFQQPVATPPAPAPAPVAPQVPAGALPLPEGGLPVGWTMEQWVHYGHQYQQ
jgi:hypothetical protein